LEQHGKKEDGEAFLFPNTYFNEWYTPIQQDNFKEKAKQAVKAADLDFKVFGEPNHIFRKAMSTYYVVNDILSWPEVCERQGKAPDNTMPDYLKMALNDLDAKAAKGFGLSDEGRESEHRMIGRGLLPQECRGCGRLNHCYRENCSYCGGELEHNQMPKGTGEGELDSERTKLLAKIELLEDRINSLEEM